MADKNTDPGPFTNDISLGYFFFGFGQAIPN
jgi:hypothetical protein